MVIVYQVKDHFIYVGVDQFENEDMIKWAQRYMSTLHLTLIWYHADKYSSPHAYIRLHEGETKPDPELVQCACQLVKNGSIEGTKKPACDIVFTPASNLKKTKQMNPGQVSFHKRELMGYERAIRKDTKILSMLEKVRSEMPLQNLEDEVVELWRAMKLKRNAGIEDDPFADNAQEEYQFGEATFSKTGDDEFDDPFESKPPPPKNKGKPKPVRPSALGMFEDIPKAEFNDHLEDDFM